MAVYRATRNELRVGIGNNYTADFFRGREYETSDEVPCPHDKVPTYIADYLVSHGILIDARTAEGPMETPAPPVSALPPTVKKIVPMKVNHE